MHRIVDMGAGTGVGVNVEMSVTEHCQACGTGGGARLHALNLLLWDAPQLSKEVHLATRIRGAVDLHPGVVAEGAPMPWAGEQIVHHT